MKLLSYYEEKAQQTDAELCKDGLCIEPEWTRAHAVAEHVMAKFEAEQFKPLLKKISDHVTEHLWDLLRDHIIEDTHSNIVGHIRYRIEHTIHALLGGESWAVDLYVTGKGWDKATIRKGLAEAIPVQLQQARMKDMEEEIETLKKELQREREWARR